MRTPENSSLFQQSPIGQIVQRVLASGRLTREDEQVFLQVVSNSPMLSHQEIDLVIDVLDRLHMGLLKVTD